MVVDATAPLTIRTLANAFAHIDAIRQLDANTGVWYNLFPEGQQGYCTAGALAWINMNLRNIGDIAGYVYLKITRSDNGAVIWNQNYFLNVQEETIIDQINFVMPSYDLELVFEIGHV